MPEEQELKDLALYLEVGCKAASRDVDGLYCSTFTALNAVDPVHSRDVAMLQRPRLDPLAVLQNHIARLPAVLSHFTTCCRC